MIRYTITAIKKSSGEREMAFDRNNRNTYETKKEADDMLKNVFLNNSADTIKELVGDDLKVMPVECFDSGDPCQMYFDNKK